MSILEKEIQPGECKEFTQLNDSTYINTYGFGKFSCNDCNRVIYKDKYNDELEIAELKLSSDKTVVMSCQNVSTAEILVVPDTVASFADKDIFSSAKNLRHILFGENSIYLSLYNTNIEHIYLPKNTGVSLWACKNLKTVIWADGVTSVDQYGQKNYYNGTFYTAHGLKESSVENVVIPVSLKEINNNVFFNCNSLTNVYYMGTSEQWDNIVIADGNVWLTEANRYYYSENEPITEGNYWHYVDGIPTMWELSK